MKYLSNPTDIVYDENATAKELLTLVGSLSIVWALFFVVTSAMIRPLVFGRPWLVAAGERDYERGGKELYEKFGLNKTKEEFVEHFMTTWPWICGIIVQHLIGGMLCLPSILGIGDQDTAASLACLGILSEMGWEIQDIITWIYKRFFSKDGKATAPMALIILLAIHHSMTTVLGLPVIINYRSLKTLHWICFNLQAAAATSLMITEYTKMLDITKPSQLKQFQVLTLVALVIMVWTRGVHWVYLSVDFIRVWYQEKAWGFLTVGSVMILIFSLFNWAFCIEPYYKRFMKFVKVSAEYKALPEDASAQKRRSSVLELEKAAADVFGHHQLDQELAAMFVTNRKVSRRSTMPSSMRERTRRASWNLLRSSVGDVSRVLSQLSEADSDILKDG